MKLEKYEKRLQQMYDNAKEYAANNPYDIPEKRLKKYEEVINEAISLKEKNKELKQEIKALKKEIDALEAQIPFDDELEDAELDEYY